MELISKNKNKNKPVKRFENSGKIEFDPRTHYLTSISSTQTRSKDSNGNDYHQSLNYKYILDDIDDGSTEFYGIKLVENGDKPYDNKIWYRRNPDGTINYSHYINNKIMSQGENIAEELMDNIARYLYNSMIQLFKNNKNN